MWSFVSTPFSWCWLAVSKSLDGQVHLHWIMSVGWHYLDHIGIYWLHYLRFFPYWINWFWYLDWFQGYTNVAFSISMRIPQATPNRNKKKNYGIQYRLHLTYHGKTVGVEFLLFNQSILQKKISAIESTTVSNLPFLKRWLSLGFCRYCPPAKVETTYCHGPPKGVE